MSQLYLVSIGPGDHQLLPPLARQAIAAARAVVGYGRYLDLLGDLCAHATCHARGLGEERARVHLALDLAAGGEPTALIGGGDIGIYALATLLFESLAQQQQGEVGTAAWQQVEVAVIPGISAMQANASASGAILGHDFCAISLSDLLTPWDLITKRIECAAAGDFIITFYNPVSAQRHWQLDHARNLLLQHRPPTTPVVIGRNLTRPDQTVTIIELQALRAAEVDMLTCVTVGNSQTQRLTHRQQEWVYSPRGYGSGVGA